MINAEESNEELKRELNLFDLLMIGIGGTVGTGIFATAGDIINGTAGPAAFLSWIFAGFGCMYRLQWTWRRVCFLKKYVHLRFPFI